MPQDVVTLFASGSADAVPLKGCPITLGVPFARGACRDATALGARRPDGASIPMQARALDRWADGSVRWALVSLQVDVVTDGPVAEIGAAIPSRPPNPAISARASDGETTVDTGRLRARLGAAPDGRSIATFSNGDVEVDLALVVTAQDGTPATLTAVQVTLEEAGPLRTIARLQGTITVQNNVRLQVVARLHFFSGHAASRVDVTLHNPRAAVHNNGCWDLGDPGSVLLKSFSIVVTPRNASASDVRCSTERDRPLAVHETPLLLHQDSSGGENWHSTNHINRNRTIPRAFRGYRLTSGGDCVEGLRATPIAVMGAGNAAVSIAMEQFWQNFPKAIACDGRTLELHLFPPQDLDLHELQGGEQKTHSFHIALGEDTISASPLDWVRRPILAHVDPAYAAATGAVPYLTPDADAPSGERIALVRSAIDGPDTFAAKREVIDEYGWRHFGDVYGDHEAVRHTGPSPLVSHYNNQYDPIEGFAIQFLQSADRRWWNAMLELAWHVADIDIYHTDRDKAAYNGGLFWHTVHYIDADTATHRTYPSSFGHGGGPANEQNYVSGLRLAWLLTGEPVFREAAIELAEFPIRIDDGSRTAFRWLARGATGHATSSGTPQYHGPGRGSGNSLSALVDGFQLTGERRYLTKADEIIRRVVHPNGDIAANDLHDPERRWFYTMFLQALGRYLDLKEELGERDRMYTWARASLLHYARWMTAHEYPYLDKPEILEFPTETWAAQETRKSDVFYYAERYAETADERARFRERGAFFFKSAIEPMQSSPTRTLARPVIVLLTSGRLHDWFERHRGKFAPPASLPAHDFGVPTQFEPQRVRALRRAKQLIALAAVFAVLALVAAIRWLL